MELKHDWRAFNSILYPREYFQIGLQTSEGRLVVFEEDQKIIDGVVSSGATFDDIGVDAIDMSKERLDSLASKYGVDQTVMLPRREFDQFIAEATDLGHNYYQQLEFIRERSLALLEKNAGKRKATFMVSRPHFVLDLCTGPLLKVLPRTFNMLIFLDETEGQAHSNSQGHSLGNNGSSNGSSNGNNYDAEYFHYRALLISVKQGKVDEFFEPDFSNFLASSSREAGNRLQHWIKNKDAIGEFLENRYIQPCFGLFMQRSQWDQVLAADGRGENPWVRFLNYFDSGEAAVFGQASVIKSLLAVQRVMGYFSRFL